MEFGVYRISRLSHGLNIQASKESMREYAIARRSHAIRKAGPAASIRGAEHFLAAIKIFPGTIVSGYFPVGEEFDVMPLLGRRARFGVTCCLPVIINKSNPLIFRTLCPGANLRKNPYSIPEPDSEFDEIIPNILLVPLLAFDSKGFRLGYGGGYYDRTLNMLRTQSHKILAIGMAYTEQQVEHVPHDFHDERLDWVVTERGAMPITEIAELART